MNVVFKLPSLYSHQMFIRSIIGAVLRLMQVGLFVCVAFLWFSTPTGFTTELGKWYEGQFSAVRLVSSVKAVGDNEELRLGLQFRMQPGWKIYWRTPGDAGFPPQPKWGKSQNLAAVEMRWPAPARFEIFNLQTLGYENEVIFPLNVRLHQPGQAVQLRANISYLICKEICIPEAAFVLLTIPSGPADPTKHAGPIARFNAHVPGDGILAGLSIHSASMAMEGKKVTLTVDVRALAPFMAPDLYIEGPDQISFGSTVVQLHDNRLRAVITAQSDDIDAVVVADEGLVLTLVDGVRAMEKQILISLTQDYRAAASSAILQTTGITTVRSMTMVLLLALLGGLILNLMPCVLPVLSIKLLDVVQHGGAELSVVRRNFIASTVGIFASFMFIVGLLIALKSGGLAIGWGIQFQQPVFLVAMTVIVTLFACNMFGLFDINLPQSIAGIALHGNSRSVSGSFLTGAFATLLATPCSAPFLGTAVGFALSRGSLEIFLIFTSLSIGFATPYLLVAAFPGVVTWLPQPGRWMVWLRYFMGVALIVTAMWLLFVLKLQIGLESSAIIAMLMILIAAVIFTRFLAASKLGRHAGKVVIALAIVAVTLPIVRDTGSNGTAAQASVSELESKWREFDRNEINRLVTTGNLVFVDVTASWCITCQVNKKMVIQSGKVAKWLSQDDVVAMRADWSRPDPVISKYLASYGRYGIPFNVIYGKKMPKGVVLPELLTSSAVLNAARLAGSNEEHATN